MAQSFSKDDILGYECKHAVYTTANDGSDDDLVVVKEYTHLKDGRRIPNLKCYKNFKRDFWVTREGHQKHKDKKEWEKLERLQKFSTTQKKLIPNIARAMGRPAFKGSLKQLARSPYLYGCDVSTPTIIKHKYMETWPECVSLNSVAVLDIETDVVVGHEEIIYIALTFKDKAILVATEDFMGTIINPVEKLHQKFEQYLGEYKEKRNIDLEVVIAKTPAQAVVEIFRRAHEWEPDFITIWNITFDMPRIISALEKEGYSPADVLSDPRIPPKFRFLRYVEGPSKKETASGKIMTVPIAERWHTVESAASFYFMDSMCLYKRIRMAAQNEPSYSLDYQLNKHLGVRKLRFKEADQYTHLEWHQFMQAHYKIEYGIYNLFDCIGVELFDEKVKDLAQTITVQSGHSEYAVFKSQPKRLVDDLHFFCLERGRAIATVSDQMEDELDKHVVEMTDWIVTLPSHLTVDAGLTVVRELPNLKSLVYVHVADLDVGSGYPTIQRILNMSKETTYRELSRIRGVSEYRQRMAGINLTASHVNAVEVACDLFKAPTFDTLLSAFQQDIAQGYGLKDGTAG